MAGKSTFLRTIAVNYILAMTGAPVCAKDMKFIPGKLFTSMRTLDSLSDNESYFYAELRRLNMLKSKIEKGEPVFFILDEILKGTNSADKSTGSKLFLQRIIAGGGTGLIATHDTSLGNLESEYTGVIINKCFEIEIDGENISFDYKLHDGITQKMNAVFLMRQMGILD
jgi:DNA mismatch repair ATPase MutS